MPCWLSTTRYGDRDQASRHVARKGHGRQLPLNCLLASQQIYLTINFCSLHSRLVYPSMSQAGYKQNISTLSACSIILNQFLTIVPNILAAPSRCIVWLRAARDELTAKRKTISVFIFSQCPSQRV